MQFHQNHIHSTYISNFSHFFVPIFNRRSPEYLACEVIALGEKTGFKDVAYAFQKDSPYLEIFNYFIRELREKGAKKQILEKYKGRGQVCPDMSGQPLEINTSFSAFILLLGESIMIFKVFLLLQL